MTIHTITKHKLWKIKNELLRLDIYQIQSVANLKTLPLWNYGLKYTRTLLKHNPEYCFGVLSLHSTVVPNMSLAVLFTVLTNLSGLATAKNSLYGDLFTAYLFIYILQIGIRRGEGRMMMVNW